jgi:hypothetical protein
MKFIADFRILIGGFGGQFLLSPWETNPLDPMWGHGITQRTAWLHWILGDQKYRSKRFGNNTILKHLGDTCDLQVCAAVHPLGPWLTN